MPVVEAIQTSRKLVALTFDDGPTRPYTELVLDVLASSAVPATFFVLGAAVVPETSPFVVRAAAEGHELGNHTHSHLSFVDVRHEDTIREEILWTHRTLTALTGKEPDLIRPPYGHGLALVDTVATSLGYRATVGWSVEAEDWAEPPADEIVERLLTELHPGAIILLHDGWPPDEGPASRRTTVEALKLLLPELKARGYELVTVTQLLDAV